MIIYSMIFSQRSENVEATVSPSFWRFRWKFKSIKDFQTLVDCIISEHQLEVIDLQLDDRLNDNV